MAIDDCTVSRSVERRQLPEFCEVDGCANRARSRWGKDGVALCNKHYLRMFVRGSVDDPELPEPPSDGLCIVEGCNVGIRSARAQYCERHYYQVRRSGAVLDKPLRYECCQYCGAASDGNKYCSQRCSTRDWRGQPRTVGCVNCGNEFEPVDGAACCSAECRNEHVRAWRRSYYSRKMANDDAYRASVRSAEYKRKALKRDAFVEEVDRDFVMLRDKWTCHICREKIPSKAAWPDRLFGTLDHVIPLSQGGAHSYANIKAAHLSCNCSKGAQVRGQLGLELSHDGGMFTRLIAD